MNYGKTYRQFALLFAILIWSGQITAQNNSIPLKIRNREFPSVFQAWSKADNLYFEDKDKTIARHDLYWHTPEVFGLIWNNASVGLADGFTKESIEKAKAYKNKLMLYNPNIITIAELRYRDAFSGYLPANSNWWMRDVTGNYVYGWKEGSYIRLEFRDSTFRKNVAAKAKAVIQSGVFDGVFLDWWTENEFLAERLDLIKRVREAIGDSALILVNSNENTIPSSANYVNGLFMECWDSPEPTAFKWRKYLLTLQWAEKNLRYPRINCFETWYGTSRQELNRMRATTAMSLTCSDGYSLFCDPGSFPTPDHLHSWYDFYDVKIGKPVEKGFIRTDGAHQREFTNGTVIYNPIYNTEIVYKSDNLCKSMATGKTDTIHFVSAFDGDIFIPYQLSSISKLMETSNYIFPNPFNSYLKINQSQQIKSINVFDSSARQMKLLSETTGSETKLHTSVWPKGLYLIEIETATSTTFHKIIKYSDL